MLVIKKKSEPRSLTEYKNQQGAYFDGFPNKDDIRNSLMEEQGYLCAYCMKRISNIKDVKIEHYNAQHPYGYSDSKETLDYNNMLGVCYGNEGNGMPYKYFTCDAHRKNDILYVNPLIENTIEKIKYQPDGKIFSNDSRIQRDIDETLNLNCEKSFLQEGRKQALDSLKRELSKKKATGTWSREFLERAFKLYTEGQSNKKREYAGILLFYLNQKLNRC